MSDTKSFTAEMADGRRITVDATDEEQASRLALEQAGGVRPVAIKSGKAAAKGDDADKGKDADKGRATKPPTGEPGQTTPAGTPTGEPGSQPGFGPFAASGGNAGVGANVPTGTDGDDELKGEELDKRAAELDIEGRSSMTADEKRAAVAAAESEEGGNDGGKS